MKEQTKNLFPHLVGTSIDYSFSKKSPKGADIKKNVSASKERILIDVENALSIGGELCVILLAELYSYYSRQPYYMAVRSSITMRRYRPAVMSYLELTVEERAVKLIGLLKKSFKDRNRHLKITAVKYFTSVYPNRLKMFREYVTREELTIIA